MNSIRTVMILLAGMFLFCPFISSYASTKMSSSDLGDFVRKDPIEEKDQILDIILSKFGKRVSSRDFGELIDLFVSQIDTIIVRAKSYRPTLEKSKDPADTILEIISESSHKEDLLTTLVKLKSSLADAKIHTFFLPQLLIFQSLSAEGKAQFKEGLRVEDRLGELPSDKAKLAKISLNSDYLKILLIQRLSQGVGMGTDRLGTLKDSKRILMEFKSKLPTTLPLRNFIDDLFSKLDENARKQSAYPVILNKIISLMSVDSQAKFKASFEDDLETMQDQWEIITQIEPSKVIPLWVDEAEIERQNMLEEAERKRKEEDSIKRQKIEKAERKKKEEERKREAEEAKKEEDAKKSKLEQTKDKFTTEAKEKAKSQAEAAAQKAANAVFSSIFGDSAAAKGAGGMGGNDGLVGGIFKGIGIK